MKVGVVGLGKLGLPLVAILSREFKVYGVDISQSRIEEIRETNPFFEPDLAKYLDKYRSKLQLSTDYQLLTSCQIVFILTQTPSLDSGRFDTQYVKTALEQLHKVNPECLATVSSTVNIGDIDHLSNIHSRIAYNPEFIRQGSIIEDFLNPKFVLIGSYKQDDATLIMDVWRRYHNKPFHLVKPVEAEIIKLSLNVSFTLGISFANMIGELCESFNADSSKVLEAIYMDRRNYHPGLGFGGPCFPRDVRCFSAICKERKIGSGYKVAFLLSDLNQYTISQQVEKIRLLGKKKIGILGVAYKPRVPYTYDSQSLQIAQELLNEGYEVYVYDPLAEEEAKQALRGKVHFCPEMGECIGNAEVIFVGTPEFSKLVIDPWK